MASPQHDHTQLEAVVGDISSETLELAGNVIPRRFTVFMSHPGWPAPAELEITVTGDGPTPTGLKLGRHSAEVLPYTALHEQLGRTVGRSAMDSFLRWATAQAVSLHMANEFAAIRDTPAAVPLDEGREQIRRAMEEVWVAARPRKRRIITAGLLAEVAEVYRAAMTDGRPPTAAVGAHFTVAHSTAARWVREARQQGHLGAAQGPKPGEVQA